MASTSFLHSGLGDAGTGGSSGKSSPSRDKRPPDTRPLSDAQARSFVLIMNKDVHILSRDKTFYICAKVQHVISSFITSYANICALSRGEPLIPETITQHTARYTTITNLTVIKGSTSAALLEEREPDADIDILSKFPEPPPISAASLSEPYSREFSHFCTMVGSHALQLMSRNSRFHIWKEAAAIKSSPFSLSVVDRTTGVFNKFAPFPNGAGCIYSVGFIDPLHAATSVELDITLQFGIPSARLYRPVSPPPSPDGSCSPVRMLTSADMQWSDSTPSFSHDALEVIIPTVFGSVNTMVRPQFSALFGLTVTDISSILRSRSLQILNPDMFRGYRRLFYEITKGRLPLMIEGELPSETDKIAIMLGKVEENPMSTVKPALAPLYELVKEKSQGPEFSLNFFLNSYQTAFLIYTFLGTKTAMTAEENMYMDHAKKFLAILNREFIHEAWQSLFPDYIRDLSKYDNPVQLAMQLQELRAHTCAYTHNKVELSLNDYIRQVGNTDKVQGFFISRSLAFNQVYDLVKALKEKIPLALFDAITVPILGPVADLPCTEEEKWLILYMTRRFVQGQICYEEFKYLIHKLESFFPLWILYNPVIARSNILPCVKHFFGRYWIQAFTPDETKLLEPLLQIRVLPTDPIFPSLLYLICQAKYKKPVHPSIIAYWQREKSTNSLTDYILSVNSLPYNTILTLLFALLPDAIPFSIDETRTFMEDLLKKQPDPALFDDRSVAVIKHFVGNLIREGHLDLILKEEEYLSKLLKEDFVSYLGHYPSLFKNIPVLMQSKIIDKILQEKNIRVLHALSAEIPDLIEIRIREWMAVHPTGYDAIFLFLSEIRQIQQSLIRDARWLPILLSVHPSLALTMVNKLVSSCKDGDVIIFIKQIQGLSLEFSLSIFLSTPVESVPAIVHPSLVPGWIHMLDDQADLLTEGDLASLIKVLSKVKLSGVTPSTLVSLIRKFIDSSFYDQELTKQVLVHYLPDLYCARATKKMENITDYKQIIERLSLAINMDDQNTSLRDLWEYELHVMLADRFDLDRYLEWASMQATSEEITTNISNKLGGKKITEKQFVLLASYFENNPAFLRKLITLAESSGVTPGLIAPVYIKIIPTLPTLDLNLRSLRRLINGDYASDVILAQITNIRRLSSLTKEESSVLRECIDKLASKDKTIQQAFVHQLLNERIFADDESLIPFIISKIRADWMLFYIPRFIAITESVSPVITRALLQEPCCFDGDRPLIFIHELDKFDVDPAFFGILDNIFGKITTKTIHLPLPEIYPLIAKQINRIRSYYNTQTASVQDELGVAVANLFSTYLNIFISQIVKDNPDDLFLIRYLNKSQIGDLLPHFDRIADLLQPLFISSLIEKMKGLGFDITAKGQQEMVSHLFMQFISLVDPKIALSIFPMYIQINPRDLNIITLYGKIFAKAVEARNVGIMLDVARIVHPSFNRVEFDKKKQVFRTAFNQFIQQTKSDEMLVGVDMIYTHHEFLAIPVNNLLLNLMNAIANEPVSSRNISNIALCLESIFTRGTFNRAETKTVQTHLVNYFDKLTLEQFIELMPLLFKIKPYSNSSLNQLNKRHLSAVLSHICTSIPSEKTVNLLIFTVGSVVDEEGLNLSHVGEMTTKIEEGIPLVLSMERSPAVSFTLVSLINLYCCLIKHMPKKAQTEMISFVKALLPNITGENFEFQGDHLYLHGITSALLITKEYKHFNQILDHLIHAYATSGISPESQETIFDVIVTNGLNSSIVSDVSNEIDAFKLCQLIKHIPKLLIMRHPSNMELLVNIFEKLAAAITPVSSNESPSASSIVTAVSVDVSLHLEECLLLIELLRSIINPATPVEFLNRIIRILDKISAFSAEGHHPALIIPIYSLCFESFNALLTGDELAHKMQESARLLEAKVCDSTATPIHPIATAFIYQLSIILHNLNHSALKTGSTRPDVDQIAKLQLDFIMLIDIHIYRKIPKVRNISLLPFGMIPQKQILPCFHFMKHFLTITPKKLEEQIQYVRISIGLLGVMTWGCEFNPTKEDLIPIATVQKEALGFFIGELRPRVITLATSIIDALTNPKYSGRILECIDIIARLLHRLDVAQSSHICMKMIEEFIINDGKKEKPNRQLVLQTFGVIVHLGKEHSMHIEARRLAKIILDNLPPRYKSLIDHPELREFKDLVTDPVAAGGAGVLSRLLTLMADGGAR